MPTPFLARILGALLSLATAGAAAAASNTAHGHDHHAPPRLTDPAALDTLARATQSLDRFRDASET